MATTWPPAPSTGGFLIISSQLAQWLIDNGKAQDAALDNLAAQNAALQQQVNRLLTLLTDPVRGRITIHVGEVTPMAIAVHPTDNLDVNVVWDNAESQPIPGADTTTTWALVDSTGAAIANGPTLTVDPANDEHATVAPPLEGTNTLPFSYFIQASTMNQAGTAVTALSDSIDVADTNPATGTVSVTVTA